MTINEGHSSLCAADLAGGDFGERVSRRDEGRDLRDRSGSALAPRSQAGDAGSTNASVSSSSERVRGGFEIPDGDCECGECEGSPADYLESYGVRCPLCNGLGHRPDPDFYADDSAFFDARAELGTMPRLRGNGRGQL